MKIIAGIVKAGKTDKLVDIMENLGSEQVFDIMEDIFISDKDWNETKYDLDLDDMIRYMIDYHGEIGMSLEEAERAFQSKVTASVNNRKIYFETDTLWVAYGQGSGITSYMPDIKKYLTSDSDDTHYDSIVNKIEKFAEENKPLKKKSNVKLYEVPYYDKYEYGRTLDIWGGDIKPSKKYYLIITEEKHTVVNIFDNKNEAMGWIKSIT